MAEGAGDAPRDGARRGQPTELPVWRSRGRRAAVLFGLSGFAISQPLLGVLGDNPITLAFHGTGRAELVALAVAVALGPPVVLTAFAALASVADARVGRVAYLVVVAGLSGAAVVQWVKAIGHPPAVLLAALAVAGALAFTIAHVRIPSVTAWASYTAVLPLLAAGTFLVASPSAVLLRSAAAPERERSEAPPVVLIVLDELPTRTLMDQRGRLDAERFPNLAALAGDATWYRHHTTLAPFTENAMPSLLTGSDPSVTQPVWTEHPDNLFTLLAPTHELEVMETGTQLCPYDTCSAARRGGGPGFRDLLALTGEIWWDRVSSLEPPASDLEVFDQGVQQGLALEPDDRQLRATSARPQALRETFDRTDPSTLYFLHLLLPHGPWRFHADGTLYGDGDPFRLTLPSEDRAVSRSWSPWESVVSEQRHLLQMQHVDALLGQVLTGLREEGLYDDSLVIVTADHGFSFEARTPPRRMTEETLDAIAYTPLFVKRPGQHVGAVDDSNVMAIDVLPTIADELGIELPFEVDGSVIGSAELADRGTVKRFYDLDGPQAETDDPPLEYDDEDTYPSVPGRLLGPLTDPNDPLSAMEALLPVDGVLGTSMDDLGPRPADEGLAVLHLDELRRPLATPLGVVFGAVDRSVEGVALLAVDGRVVAGSPLHTDTAGRTGLVSFVLPSGALDDRNEIRAALVAPDGTVQELELRSW